MVAGQDGSGKNAERDSAWQNVPVVEPTGLNDVIYSWGTGKRKTKMTSRFFL